MFLSSDFMSTRKTKSIDSRGITYNTVNTENQNFHDEKDKEKFEQQDSLTKKVEKFISVNKKHQFDEVCVCEDCIYVKQLQRYESLKMDLSKNSSYRAQYNKNNLKRNFSKTENLADSSFTVKPQESSILKNPHVHMDSVYRNEYASRSLEKIEKPHPSDLLKFTGPSSTLSSYKQMYHNIDSSLQYVEPLRHENSLLPSRRFKAESLYANDYKVTKTVETESGKINDQLRLGKPLMVTESTHKSQYVNPENYNLKTERYSLNGNKRVEEPNFSYQYKTINRDEFERPPSKKNCRTRRLQVLHGQLLTSENFSTIA